MLFACNIGNTHITLGVFDGDQMVFSSKIATTSEKSTDEYAILFSGIFAMNQVALSGIHTAVLSSVVRPLNTTIIQAIERLMQVNPLLVGPGVKTGLNIKTDIPSQIGADIVAESVAALTLADCPLIILALGTATTLTAIDAKGELSGVLISPGMRSSLNALSAQAAELPRVALEKPRMLLGKNTVDSMVSGMVYGHAAMIDGLLDRIADEWQLDSLTVIATGSLAEPILPYLRSRHKVQLEPDLTLLGLKKIGQLNSHHKK